MSDKQKWFTVKDLETFVTSTRQLIYNNFGNWNNKDEEDLIDKLHEVPIDKDDFDLILSQKEAMVIVKSSLRKQTHKYKKTTRYLISDNIFLEIVSQLNDRIISNTVSGLVKKGLLESAYDEKLDDFVFWVKENIDELPKTD